MPKHPRKQDRRGNQTCIAHGKSPKCIERIHDNWLAINQRAGVKEEIQIYWPFRDDVAVIDGILMKGRKIVVQASFPPNL